MGEVIEFKPKKRAIKHSIPHEPTEHQLKSAHVAIANDTWEWGYVVDVFFKYTETGVNEDQLRKCIYKHFPMASTEEFDDNNTRAYRSVIFTPKDRNIHCMNEVLDSLDNDWELNFHLPYFLETDYEKDEYIFISFLEDLPDGLQWQVAAGWYDLR